MELDWGNAHHISTVREAASGLKLLLGADVCYSLQAVTKTLHNSHGPAGRWWRFLIVLC